MKLKFLIYTLLLCSVFSAHAAVDHTRIVNADNEPGSWLSHGRNYSEDRQSPLTGITPANVNTLGLAWSFDTNTSRGLEASPLVIDGVIYTTGSWSKVYAISAKTGQLLWEFDPKVPLAWAPNACCDVVNRGVAAWGGSLFLGALDGRLIAIDMATGKSQWETQTIDATKPYTITGAPRVIKGNVIIGNGGAELGVRGYISAYDVKTGEMSWRFYTVPGNPATPAESDTMKMAAKTWSGDVYWKLGGGGTVWDSMAYDPDLNLLYFGVGNGSPWNREIRSPGGGDNLFLSSIVAVNPDTGKYVWHYQTTPGDTWDYTATQHIVLADLELDGKKRKVLMQAPKNGFFYVLDRTTGQLISAEKYTSVSWASHIDKATGRPIETENADHVTRDRWTLPGPLGGHNWHPMAFNQDTGLVYIPAQTNRFLFSTPDDFKARPGLGIWNLGQKEVDETIEGTERMPMDIITPLVRDAYQGYLLAWDPIAQKERWRVEHNTMSNGGVLTTRSGLVFQGTGDGRLVAYDAINGKTLWQSPTGTGVVAPPISYELDGTQYIAVMAGWGGAAGLANFPGDAPPSRGRLLVYALGGTGTIPTPPDLPVLSEAPPPRNGTAASFERGALVYSYNCEVCHGIQVEQGTILPDLRYMSNGTHERFESIVLGGLLKSVGMKSFAKELSKADVQDLHNYLLEVANLAWEAQAPKSPLEQEQARKDAAEVERKAALWFKENTPPI